MTPQHARAIARAIGCAIGRSRTEVGVVVELAEELGLHARLLLARRLPRHPEHRDARRGVALLRARVRLGRELAEHVLHLLHDPLLHCLEGRRLLAAG
eukprot:4279718-Prymnesium_polylepis.2